MNTFLTIVTAVALLLLFIFAFSTMVWRDRYEYLRDEGLRRGVLVWEQSEEMIGIKELKFK